MHQNSHSPFGDGDCTICHEPRPDEEDEQ
jgi:predicted CXXCH cytochrome family protein